MSWKDRVIFRENVKWADYIVFIDESGTSSYKDKDKYFTLTATIFKSSNFELFRDEIVKLKNKYWCNGIYNNKKVVFHSIEISKKKGAFSCINYDDFANDLANEIIKTDFTVLAATVDKSKMENTYRFKYDCYNLSCTFILERICKFIIPNNKTCSFLFEARGKKEDNLVHKTIMNIIKNGTAFVDKKIFENINGIYFAKKRIEDNLRSFPGIELSDLCSHDLFYYIRTGKKTLSFNLIENKIYRKNGKLYGLKLFP